MAVWMSMVAGLQQLPGRQGGVNRVGQGEDRGRPGPGEELAAGAQDGLAGQGVLFAPVVALVIHADVNGRQPQDLGLFVKSVLCLDRGAGRLDDQRPGVRQPQRGSQVDRQRPVGFFGLRRGQPCRVRHLAKHRRGAGAERVGEGGSPGRIPKVVCP